MEFIKGQEITINGKNYIIGQVGEIKGQVILDIVNKRSKLVSSVYWNPCSESFGKVFSTGQKLFAEEIEELEDYYKATQRKNTQPDDQQAAIKTLESELADAEDELKRVSARVERLKAAITATKTVRPVKAQIAEIILTRYEGRSDECGRPVRVGSWDAADDVIKTWAINSPVSVNGCHKCSILFTFSDGESFKMGFELRSHHAFYSKISQNLMTELKFLSGECPNYMTQEQYESYKRFAHINVEAYRKLLEGWEIPA